MEKYLMEESVLNVQVFDEDSRFKSNGGFEKINKIFQNQLENIVIELNEYLYDTEVELHNDNTRNRFKALESL